ncbi:glycoside-pentoside-hexuronide (GPH):cation symporter [Aeromonas veronii]|uniref:glycoside-pentoside-hexuronide (GPH):cation symporter n=1 Tax=Aeromonas veronii TaxID=654 RepID=UPI001116C750|nr:glycoside-pentoside-hexuronide (GPH):cation symporter [Aeromonas veronii]TNI02211.1 MFS transporter [Aeromonas veronii]HDO1313996.1 MFS transporter [Aeromonas veronii]
MTYRNEASDRLAWQEKMAYGVGDLGYNFLLNCTTLYLLIFLTDVAAIPAAWAGAIFLVSKFFTACTDLVTGSVLDNRSELGPRGKFRPFLLWTIVPLALINTALFTSVELPVIAKTVLFTLLFMMFGAFYSFGNASYGAMVPALTKRLQDRAELAAWRQGGANTGLLLCSVGFMPLVLLFDKPQVGYSVAVLIYSVMGAAAVLFCYSRVRERHVLPSVVNESGFSAVQTNARAVLANRPLGILALANLLTLAAFNTKLIVQVFYAQYVIGDVSMIAYMSFISIGCIYLGVLLVPFAVHRFGKLPVYLAGIGVWICGDLLNYLYNESALDYILFTSLALWGSAFVNSLNWAFISDTVEYGEWKTGIRTEGLVYCSLTFCRKCSAALAGLIPGLVLAWSGYVPNATQSTETQSSIANLMFLYPICALICAAALMLLFYPLTDARYQQIVRELAQRHALSSTRIPHHRMGEQSTPSPDSPPLRAGQNG